MDQVVREPKMKFFKVPRLGSYLAIRLSYQSCLSEKAIEEAIADKVDVERRREEQEAEKKAHEEDIEAAKEAEDENAAEELEEKVWEEIQEKDFLVSENKYTVCIDTMGQDRSLSQEQIDFCIKVVKDFANTWQKAEKDELKKDIENNVEAAKKDREFMEVEGPNVLNDEEKYVEDMLNMREDLETDEQRDKEAKVYKLQFISSQISGLTTEPELSDDEEKDQDDKTPKPAGKGKDSKKPDAKKDKKPEKKSSKKEEKPKPKEEHKEGEGEGEGDTEKPKRPITPRVDEKLSRWRNEILNLKNAKLIRYPRILQCIFYLLGYTRDQICEENTNKLWWKKAKKLINDDFFMRLYKYDPVGPKESEYKPYQKINYIEKV